MAFPMERIPTDVFACIIEYLLMDDICAMTRVSKAYHAVAQPLLWTVIEVHHSDFHIKTTHKALRAEEATRRMIPPYNIGLSDEEKNYGDDRGRGRGEKFLKTFSGDQTWGTELREGRKKELGALVRWLCLPMTTRTPNTLARNFAHFVNLEHLEISGFWEPNSGMDVFKAPLPGLRKLTTLKLSGYLPKEFVRGLLMEPDRIEELQLAILDGPVGYSNNFYRVNPPPPVEDMTEEELAEAEEFENWPHEWFAPRALACLTPEIMSRLVNLKRLYLCKPSNGSKDYEDLLLFSTVSDERILREWNALLRVTRKTLQHLTLDQRAVAQEDVRDKSDARSFMQICANGPSYDRFVKMVLPTLLESKGCPSLKVVRLFGFEPHDGCGHADYPDRSVDVPGQIRAASPGAEVSDYAGSRLVIRNYSGEVESGVDVIESDSSDSDSE